jgi:hypothetical protein
MAIPVEASGFDISFVDDPFDRLTSFRDQILATFYVQV